MARPADAPGPTPTPELQVLRDDDGLDRVRRGDFDAHYPRPACLTVRAGRARELGQATREAPAAQAWARVRQAARELGLAE